MSFQVQKSSITMSAITQLTAQQAIKQRSQLVSKQIPKEDVVTCLCSFFCINNICSLGFSALEFIQRDSLLPYSFACNPFSFSFNSLIKRCYLPINMALHTFSLPPSLSLSFSLSPSISLSVSFSLPLNLFDYNYFGGDVAWRAHELNSSTWYIWPSTIKLKIYYQRP